MVFTAFGTGSTIVRRPLEEYCLDRGNRFTDVWLMQERGTPLAVSLEERCIQVSW
jgi:hypothetical protein